MDSIDYTRLYALQDRVLETVFSVEREFYLTGGTCLSRFYHEKRYSDDLDFFTNHSPRFSFAVKNIKTALQKDYRLTVEVQSKDFIRFKVDGLLQLDFVNDVYARYKEVVVTSKGFLIDNIENILSNKLTAVVGRDDVKDIFDIYLISMYHSFSWENILTSAHEKAGFLDEDLIVRLKSFPLFLLEKINIIDTHFLEDFEHYFPVLIKEIQAKGNHIAKC